MKKPTKKTRTVKARVVGAIPDVLGNQCVWRVRMVAPFLPFYLDGQMRFSDKKRADAMAEKWRAKQVTITIRSS